METFNFENENIREESIRNAYIEFQEAQDEEDKIMEAITAILEKTEDREEARKMIEEKYKDSLDKAMERSHEAQKHWREAIQRKMLDIAESQEE